MPLARLRSPIAAGTHAWLYYREAQGRELRASQLEALLAETRLQMLSMQLQPHFLFNTLNTIAELVHDEAEAAERMIGGLSHLLRETLHAGLVDRVPLDQELALLDRYVEIPRLCFTCWTRATQSPRRSDASSPRSSSR